MTQVFLVASLEDIRESSGVNHKFDPVTTSGATRSPRQGQRRGQRGHKSLTFGVRFLFYLSF